MALAEITLVPREYISLRPELKLPAKVLVGQRFEVDVMVRDLDPVLAGLVSVAVCVDWDEKILEVLGWNFTEHLPLGRKGRLRQDIGFINDLYAYAILEEKIGRNIGNLKPDKFSTILFRAIATGTSEISTTNGPSGIIPTPFGGSLKTNQVRHIPVSITVR